MSGQQPDPAKQPASAQQTPSQQKKNAFLAVLTIFDERLNRAPDRWLYRAAALATILYTIYVGVTAVVFPYWNYLLVTLFPAVIIMMYVRWWRKDRYAFRLWNIRCGLMLNLLLTLSTANICLFQTDYTIKAQGAILFVITAAWFALWCISCYEGDRYAEDLEQVQLKAIKVALGIDDAPAKSAQQ